MAGQVVWVAADGYSGAQQYGITTLVDMNIAGSVSNDLTVKPVWLALHQFMHETISRVDEC